MMKAGAKEVKAPTLVIGRLPMKQKLKGCAVIDLAIEKKANKTAKKPAPMNNEKTPTSGKPDGKRQAK